MLARLAGCTVVSLLFAAATSADAAPLPLCESFVPLYPTDGAVDVPLNTFLVGRIEKQCPTSIGDQRTGLTLTASDHRFATERLAGQ